MCKNMKNYSLVQAEKSANSHYEITCLKLRFHGNVSVGCYVRRFVNKNDEDEKKR